ncbi:unknown [Eubacterium sp. CAG:603]|jgi:hypothetical protein|nr:unknown [Eubacterium sp. CAG:603]
MKIKKMFMVMLSVMVCEVSFINSPISVLADIVNQERQDEEFKENSTLEYYLNEEIKNNTGILGEEVEKELNRQGIFDSELELFSDKEINEIEQAEDIQVISEYLEVVENNDETEEREMNNEEIDELIMDTFYSEEKSSVIEDIGKKVGLIPQDVYGVSIDANSTSYVKRSFVIFQYKGIISVTGINYWLKMPENRYTDIVKYSWSGAQQYINKSYKCVSKTQYTFDEHYEYDGNVTFDGTTYHEEDFSDLIKQNLNYGPDYIEAPFDLPDYDYNYSCRGAYGERILDSFVYKITFYLEALPNSKKLSLFYDYQHQKKKLNKWNAFKFTNELVNAGTSLFAAANAVKAFASIANIVSAGAGASDLFTTYYKTIGTDGSFEYVFK